MLAYCCAREQNEFPTAVGQSLLCYIVSEIGGGT